MSIYAIRLVNGIEITVIYTDRDPGQRHIISAWRSEPHGRTVFLEPPRRLIPNSLAAASLDDRRG